MTTEQRFWAKVDKTGPCWPWTGYRSPPGYGRFGLDGDAVEAHRVAWLLTHGPIPDGLYICHVRTIRRLLSEGEAPQRIADRFGCSPSLVSQIKRGVIWRHVPELEEAA